MSLPEGALSNKIKTAPREPGCYLFTDKYENIIYVGKAKNLRNRVKSYFTKAAAEDERTEELVPKIVDVEFRVVETELDALLLEYRLIKRFKPWFNSALKPDKQRPYLRIAPGDPYATLSVSVAMADDGADYYDFFTDTEDVKQALSLLCKVWGLPQCGQSSFARQAKSPCLYHSLDGCMSPCSGRADAALYATAIAEVGQLFNGKVPARQKALKQQMAQAAEELAFEQAASCKAQLEGLQRLQHKSRRRFHLPEQGAVLVLIRPHREAAFSAFHIVNGQVLRRADFPAKPETEAIAHFASALEHAGEPLADSEWLAGCLLEVGADKQFVVLPDKKTTAPVVEKAVGKFIK